MENLTESVYECTLGVEAHMICDLLSRAGISARVDGEYLAGAGGDLPLGSTIRVRVEPSQAAEARDVIDEWQKSQPPPEANPVPRKRAAWRSPLWFFAGLLVGGGLMVFGLRTPYSTDVADLDGDGIVDQFYYYRGRVVDKQEFDRNADRRIDVRWTHDMHGVPARYEADDDFDGTFEWKGEAERGDLVVRVKDADGNGRPERAEKFRHGVLHTIEIYSASGHLTARQAYENARMVSAEFDSDGDGVFERRVEYDEFEEPISSAQ
jgi:hypothetical protein